MAYFEDHRAFEQWQADKPPEWASGLAARSALRVLPLISSVCSVPAAQAAQSDLRVAALQAFRAAALSWTAARFPSLRDDPRVPSAVFRIKVASNKSYKLLRGQLPAQVAIEAAEHASTMYAAERLAATSAVYKSAHAAAALYDFHTGYHRPDAVTAAYAGQVWHALSSDATQLENGIEKRVLLASPLWPPEAGAYHKEATLVAPDWVVREQSFLQNWLQELGEDWQVWFQWYDARLHGRELLPEEVEIACALLPEDVWDAGPAVVNAEIRRIREDWASGKVREQDRASAFDASPALLGTLTKEKIEQLVKAVSPRPFLTHDGKLDAGRNPEFDRVVSSAELPSLPIRQLALVRIILSSLGDNAPKSVKSALKEYRDELQARGLQPILGVLNDMAAVVSAACSAKNAASEWLEEPARAAVELFLANHEWLVKHFPLDATREALIASISVDEEAAAGMSLSQPFEDVLNAAKAARAAGFATDEFVKIVDKMAEFAKLAATEPLADFTAMSVGTAYRLSAADETRTPSIAATAEDRFTNATGASARKRSILTGVPFFERAAQLASAIATVADSPAAKSFAQKLWDAAKRLAAFIYSH